MKKVLITGGAGFIGSHLAETLLARGKFVSVLDNLSTGSRENIAHLLVHPKFHFLQGDVVSKADVEGALVGVAEVYHLAASVGVKHIMGNLIASILNNVHGTEVVLEYASRQGARVLLTSTSEVYGKISEKPSAEHHDFRMGAPVKSRWSYACSKALDEYLAFAYAHERQLPITIARLFNTVGERQSSAYGMVVPTFVQQALAGLPLTIHGTGAQSRCFIHVSDVVRALIQLMEHPSAVGEVFNVGSTDSVSVDALADRILRLTHSTSVKQYIPYEEAYAIGFDDAYSRRPDIQKIKQLIAFEPQHTLDDIIELVAASIQNKTKERIQEGAL